MKDYGLMAATTLTVKIAYGTLLLTVIVHSLSKISDIHITSLPKLFGIPISRLSSSWTDIKQKDVRYWATVADSLIVSCLSYII